jgi:nicotinate-nucleotide pyrophosphorylase (carboxylating)
MHEPPRSSYLPLIELARQEDLGPGDISSEVTVPAQQQGQGVLAFRQNGVLCGMVVVREVLQQYDPSIILTDAGQDGAVVPAGGVVGAVRGPLRALLAAERVMLNFLQRLSAIATVTAQYVEAVAGTKARIYDTRKTTPGWRQLEKYAVRCGGGCNHRQGLFDAVLIKDNHLAALGSNHLVQGLQQAVQQLQSRPVRPDFVQVEVDNLDQLRLVLQVRGIDMILLDNMTIPQLEQAVAIRNELCPGRTVHLEASGNITLTNVCQVAQTGVDRISVGALTHTVRSLDIGFDLR